MQNENQKIEIKNIIQIDNEILENISKLIEEESVGGLSNILTDLHPADIAELINNLKIEEATFLFNILETDVAVEVIPEVDENLREKILAKTTTEKITDIVEELDTDDATDILGELDETVAEQVLENIDEEASEEVKELLKYAEDTAGGIMSSDFISVFDTATVADAVSEVRKYAEEFEHLYYIYVLDNTEKLLGVVGLKALIINTPDKNIVEVMDEDLITVTPDMDQEAVANLMEKYDLVAVAVVDENRKMLGRITIDDAIDVLNEEASEDLQKMAGLSEEQEASDSIFRISKIRLPWLMIALVVEFFNAIILDGSLKELEKFVVATIFIPVIMAMGGSSGAQASIVMVRSLAAGNIWLSRSLRSLSKEFLVSLMNGLALSSLLFLFAYAFQGLFNGAINMTFTYFLSFALLIVIISSTLVGACVPLVLKKFKIDPAIASGPFVTTMNDVLGLTIYLAIFRIYLNTL